MNSFYHDGEKSIQEQMGVRDKAESLNSMFYKELPVVASQFLESLNFCVITFSSENEIFSSVVSDIKPFIEILNTKEILIDLGKSSFIPKNILETKDLNIGLIGLEFENRMRIRVNGKGTIENNKLHLLIDVAYSNCPRFINDRKIMGNIDFFDDSKVDKYFILEKACKKIIENADTFFLGTSHKNGDADISHKGGKKGFLKVVSPTELEFDDFPGNNMYNTLGNIHINPNVSIVVIDFSNNDVLHINGIAKIIEEIKNEKKKLKVKVECVNISIESNTFILKYDK
jgi:predicted pyridoxine 5'-phosphate oxidase superfamily flavin-nucleotide-binding protein